MARPPLISRLLLLAALVCSTADLRAFDLMPYAGPSAPVVAATTQRWLGIWTSATVTYYTDSLPKNEKPDAELLTVLECAAADMAGLPMSMPKRQALARAKKLAAKRGKSDIFNNWACFRLTQGDDWRVVNRACNQALYAFETAPPATEPAHLRARSLLGFHLYTHCLKTWARPANAADQASALAVADTLARHLKAVVINESAQAPSLIISHILDFELNHKDFSEKLVAAVDEGLDEAKAEPWIAHAIKAAMLAAHGWAWGCVNIPDARSDEGWQGFERHLRAADTHLNQAYALHPDEPHLGALGIFLATVKCSNVPKEEWFRRSISAGFDCWNAYDELRSCLLPRWGGSYAAMLGFGGDCVATGRFDTNVPWTMVECVTVGLRHAHMTDSVAEFRKALANRNVTASFLATLAGYAPKRPQDTHAFSCMRAAYLWQTGQKTEAAAILNTLDPKTLDPDVARNFYVSYTDILAHRPAGDTPAKPADF